MFFSGAFLIVYFCSWRLFDCSYYVMTPPAVLCSLVFAVDVLFVLYRWTYRVFPNLFLAVAALLFYVLLCSLAHGENAILKLGIMNRDRMSIFLKDNFTKWLGWGLIGAVGSTILGKASEELWYGFSRSGTGDHAKIDYRFKQQRRKLLSYYAGADGRLKSISKMGWVVIAYGIVIVSEGILIFLLKRGDIRVVIGQAYFVAVACSIIGFILHQFITDGNLMRAENSYLLDRGSQAVESLNSDLTCEKSGWRWVCYCQVFANTYCSRNPIFYENTVLHENCSDLDFVFNIDTDAVCRARILSDLVYYHGEQFSLYCKNEANLEKLYMEAQFANLVAAYLDYIGTAYIGDPVPFSADTMSLIVIKKEFDLYFGIEEEGSFRIDSLLSVKNVSFHDVKNLILLDYIQALVNDRAENACKLSWWCRKNRRGTSEQADRAKIGELYRRQFPNMVKELMIDRWGKDSISPINVQGVTDLEDAFQKAERNYLDKWKREAIGYGIEDKEYWDSGIFAKMPGKQTNGSDTAGEEQRQ